MKKLLIFLLFPFALLAQNTTKGTIISGPAAARPTCSASFNATTANSGDIYNDIDDVNPWKCMTGTWSVLGGGLTGVENNGTPLATEPFVNFLTPFLVTTNAGNQSNDVSCIPFTNGSSHTAGCVGDPGAVVDNTKFVRADGAFAVPPGTGGTTVLPDPSYGIQYVAKTCNAGTPCSNSNDGLSRGTAKANIYNAILALPNGSSSPPTAGNGTVYVANDSNGIQFNPADATLGWWMFGPTDPNYSGGLTGWMRVPTTGTVTLQCDAPQASVIHGGGAVCQEFWGGHTDNTHPAIWFSAFSGQAVLNGFGFNFEATGFKVGIDSNNNRSTTTGTSSVLFENDQVNLGNCYSGIGAGPAVDIGGASFWVKFIGGSYSGCTTQDYSISAISRNNATSVVTATLTASGTGDIVAGSNAKIIIRNVTDPSFNGAFVITSASGTSVTWTQNGPTASSSGGQAFPYGAGAIGINSGNGPGAGFVYVLDATAANGGGLWAQGGFNGVGLSVDHLVYEGSGHPDMSPIEYLPTNGAGDTAVYINDVQPADNTVPICGVESFTGGNITAMNALLCGAMTTPTGSIITTQSPLRQGMHGIYNGHSIAINSDSARSGFSPTVVPATNVIGGSGAWTTTGLTVTNGVLAPDFTNGATRLANTSGATIQMNFGGFFSPTPVLNSYYIFGMLLKSETAGVLPLGPNFNLNSNGVGVGDFCAGGVQSVGANVASPSFIGDGQWGWFSGICKIVSNPSSGQQRLDMSILNNTTIDAYAPVLFVITSGMTDNDAWEFANNLRSYPSNALAGEISMLPGQHLRTDDLVLNPITAPTGASGSSHVYMDSGLNWPSFKPNGNTAYVAIGTSGGVHSVNQVPCASDTTTGATTWCNGGGGGGGTTNPGLLNSFAIYPSAGTTTTIGPVNGITAPIGVFGFFGSTPLAGNLAGIPAQFLAGISGRVSTVSSGTTADIINTDRAHRVKHTNAGATTISLPGTVSPDFTANFCYREKVEGSGASDTITPVAGTINGAGSLVMKQGQAALICSFDNSNYEADVFEVGGLVQGTNITFGRSDTGGLTINSTAGGGTVTHTAGNLTAGQLVIGNAVADVTVGDLSGDATTSGSTVTTVAKVNGVAYPTSPSTNTVPVVTAPNTITYELIPNASLSSAAVTVNGQACTLGQTCNVNVGSTTHGVAVNEGNGAAIASTALGAQNAILSGVTSADPTFKSLSDLSAETYGGTATGIVNVLAACPTRAATALTIGMISTFLPNLANTTTTPTYNLCTLGAKTITKHGNAVLSVNDLTTIQQAVVRYDGTEWILENPDTERGSGAIALSGILAASASNIIANGNFPQTWNWAQITNSQDAMTFGETSAATNGTVTTNLALQSEVQINTAAGSTANPLSITQGSLTTALAVPAVQIKTTWNGAGVYQGLVFSVTDTAHGASSKILNLFGGGAGTTSLFSVDTAGGSTQAGVWRLTGTPVTGTGTTALPMAYLNAGAAPTTFNTNGTFFGVNANSGFTGNMLDFHVNGGASVASLDYQGNLLVTGILDGVAPITITTGTTANLGTTNSSGYTFNQEATAGTGVTYTLPATVTGKQYCVQNSGTTGVVNIGALTVYPPASSFVILNGVVNTVGGGGTHGVVSGGAAGDSACFVAIDSTHWAVFPGKGTWSEN